MSWKTSPLRSREEGDRRSYVLRASGAPTILKNRGGRDLQTNYVLVHNARQAALKPAPVSTLPSPDASLGMKLAEGCCEKATRSLFSSSQDSGADEEGEKRLGPHVAALFFFFALLPIGGNNGWLFFLKVTDPGDGRAARGRRERMLIRAGAALRAASRGGEPAGSPALDPCLLRAAAFPCHTPRCVSPGCHSAPAATLL